MFDGTNRLTNHMEKQTILIVDDDPANRRLLQILLERAGYNILQAQDGERALEIAMQSPPHLVILDDMLPGIWGDEVRYHLKRSAVTADSKIVMYTGRMDKIAEYRRQEDVSAALIKPTPMQVILETVKRCLS